MTPLQLLSTHQLLFSLYVSLQVDPTTLPSPDSYPITNLWESYQSVWEKEGGERGERGGEGGERNVTLSFSSFCMSDSDPVLDLWDSENWDWEKRLEEVLEGAKRVKGGVVRRLMKVEERQSMKEVCFGGKGEGKG